MSLSIESNISVLEKQFFHFFYSPESQTNALMPMLKQKYKTYRHQSYNTSKPTKDINYIKKFQDINNYISYVGLARAQKTEISLIHETIQQIYNDYQQFFQEGGWKVVKNKSMRCRLQQYLLVKLARLFSQNRTYGTLDRFVLCFFYTLNYFKSCNFQIRLFNEFLLSQYQLDYFFIFIILRKRSRRLNRDLVIRSQYVTSFIKTIKSEDTHAKSISHYQSQAEQIGQIKLLLIYSEIVQYIQNNHIVLHQVMLFNLMKSMGLCDQQATLFPSGRTNWNQFISMYFSQFTKFANSGYQTQLIEAAVNANLTITNKLFPQIQNISQPIQNSRQTFNDSEIAPPQISEKQKFMEQTFSYLIKVLQSIIYHREGVNAKWRLMYQQFSTLFEYNITIVKKLVGLIFKDQQYFKILMKYRQPSQH